MFSQISWNAYFSFITIVVAIYYVVILFLYYRKQDVKSAFLKLSNIRFSKIKPAIANGEVFTNTTFTTNDLIKDINYCIQQASKNYSPKEEIVFGLQKLLDSPDYKELTQPAYRKYISQFIVEECNKHCSIHLSEEDLRVLWI